VYRNVKRISRLLIPEQKPTNQRKNPQRLGYLSANRHLDTPGASPTKWIYRAIRLRGPSLTARALRPH
jgi:hypothetical protein